MEVRPGEYQKLQIRQYPQRTLRETKEGRFWQQFRGTQTLQQVGGVTHIDFAQVWPFNYAATSSTRVLIYNGRTNALERQITRFKDIAYSGCFRSDARLLTAGGESGVVQVFDAGSRAVLRQFKGHQRPVHVARFSPDKLHVLSGGDDATVRWWDVTEGKAVSRLKGHTDYVRAAAVSPLDSNTWATGGYDHTCRVWDVRSQSATVTLDHGAPIESLTWFPSGTMAVTAGGTSLCIWDMLAGGRLLKRLANFQKTVTSVTVSPQAGPASEAAPRLLAGSLDAHVKIFELNAFKVTHAIRYPAAVLSLGLSPDCATLAVGMANGLLSVKRHVKPPLGAAAAAGAPAKRVRYKPRLTAASFRYFLRGQGEQAAADDHRVAARRRARLTPYDKALRQFRYREALDAALERRRPEVVASLLGELSHRGGLDGALGNRDAASLEGVLRHVCRYIGDPRHSRQMALVGHRILDTYGAVLHTSPTLRALAAQLLEGLQAELKTQAALQRLQGSLEPLIASAMARSTLEA